MMSFLRSIRKNIISFLKVKNWKQKYDYKILKRLNYQPDKSQKADKLDRSNQAL